MRDKVRVLSFNVLTPHFAGADTFVRNSASDLSSRRRLDNLLTQLSDQMENYPTCVICLQEVCQNWANRLIRWFENLNYHFVYRLYGSAKSGHMGVGIAYARDHLRLLGCNISRVTDSVQSFIERADNGTSAGTATTKTSSVSLSSWLFSCAQNAWFGAGYNGKCNRSETTVKRQKDWLHHVCSKYQCAIVLEFETRTVNRRKFNVATCHMPCDWRNSEIMMLHALLLTRCVQTSVLNSHTPLIFAGDFNTRPGEMAYKALTQPLQDLPKHTEDDRLDLLFQSVVEDLSFDFEPFESAYVQVQKSEPEYTTNCYSTWKNGSGDVFCDTIDYVLLRNCHATEVLDLYHKRKSHLLPSAHLAEPSDHLMIGATVEV